MGDRRGYYDTDDEEHSFSDEGDHIILEEGDEIVMGHQDFEDLMKVVEELDLATAPSDDEDLEADDHDVEFDPSKDWAGVPDGGFDFDEKSTGRYFNYNDITLSGLTTRQSNMWQKRVYKKMEESEENAKIKIDLNVRKRIIAWLCLVQQSTGVPTRALFIAVEAFDLFTRFTPLLETEYQMAALVCLKLALKGRPEDKDLTKKKISDLLAAGYTMGQFVAMMRRAEIVLEEYLRSPFDSFSDLPPIVNASNNDDLLPKPVLYLIARYCLELGLSEPRLVKYRTNYRAAAAVLAVRHVVFHEDETKRIWTSLMALISDIYPTNNLWAIARIYMELVEAAPTQNGHIYTKYNQQCYRQVASLACSNQTSMYSAIAEIPNRCRVRDEDPAADNPLKYPEDEPDFVVN